ncbi:hypothetical protein GUJ93_ZPchr0006g42014 [Zizania palustris]|uniref:At4g14310 8-bladed propeller domain-containing protein n=1 Tax=Zizania palustris TaxID=103762 RepID=A0A8J5W2B4_ZIZPA|nr:hypothetical protein GUJ93_ZPchr0006g42014 [Zizania palustris]
MASRLKDRGKPAATASRPLTPKISSSSSSARRNPAPAGKENSASNPSKHTSAVRWSTSSIPRASRIPSSVDSSKIVYTLSASAMPGRTSIGKDMEVEAGLRRSVSGVIRAAPERARRSVSGVGARVSDARRASSVPRADEIGRRKEGFDARAKGVDETSGRREGFDAKAKHTHTVDRKRESFDSKAKQISVKRESLDVNVAKPCDEIKGKREGSDTNAKKQCDGIGGEKEGFDVKNKPGDEINKKKEGLEKKLVKEICPEKTVAGVTDSAEASSKAMSFSAAKKDDDGGNNVVIPVFTVHVVDSNDVPCIVREEQKNTEEPKKKEEKGKLADKIRVFQQASASGEGRSEKSLCGLNKYPSKLHEKLAALEGRVQKIATEIKKTKEMLDENNPDEPKQILSNIQKEITSIEKAISHVKDDNKIQLGTADSNDCEISHAKKAAKCAVTKPIDLNHSTRAMNTDELEVRFFPHHKLLRDRILSSATQQESCMAMKKDCNRKMELSASDPQEDEHGIAMEFLASLDGEESDFFKNHKAKNLEKNIICEAADVSSKTSGQGSSNNQVGPNHEKEIELLSSEKLEEFDEQENKSSMILQDETEEFSSDQLFGIGNKSSTGGWFVSEGEAVLLAHGDGTCSYYDIANREVKSEYKPPNAVSNNMWGDCWLIRAPGVDGCSGRYVVAASTGNVLDPGFCSWDYYSREPNAFHVENVICHTSSVPPSRTVLGPLPNLGSSIPSSATSIVERQQWWYRPCGPLLLSAASKQKMVTAYDIRDGDIVMKWEVNSPVQGMEYSSPLQWRSRGKVVIAGTESIGLWDVNSLNPQPLLSVASAGKKLYCLHVNNTDAEVGGGVRQRVSSSEVEGNDGVFSTQESVNIFDFRVPAGIGLKIARHGGTASSIFSRGDSVFIGSTEGRMLIKGGLKSRVQHYSLRKGKLVATYELPDFNAHFHHASITQVWGNSNIVLAACGMGLFAFDTLNEDVQQTCSFVRGATIGVREAIGSDDLYCPTFDYSSSRVLLVSRDRPAHWRYLS